jgi:phage baseplate assembly protein W
LSSPLAQPNAFPLGGNPPTDAGAPQGSQLAVFGRDLLFTDDVQVGPNGDYVVVDGVENLRRAILRRLVVKPGEYRLRPEYGVGVGTFVKKPMTRATLDELQQRIVDNLSQEKRIDRLLQVIVNPTTYGGYPGLYVDIQAQAFGREVHFEPFTFARGQG